MPIWLPAFVATVFLTAMGLYATHLQRRKARTFSVRIDKVMDSNLDELAASFGESREEVFRTGITILKLADDAQKSGWQLALIKPSIKPEGMIIKEIILPSAK